jgi:hypothetical protein
MIIDWSLMTGSDDVEGVDIAELGDGISEVDVADEGNVYAVGVLDCG